MKRTFSSDERAEFARLKEQIRQRLKQQEPDSVAIVLVGQEMHEIRRRSWHEIDAMDDSQEWARVTFGMCPRKASDFFTIGASGMRPEVVAGSGLDRKAVHQVALAPAELRQALVELAVREGLSAGAMSAGRRAALPLLRAGDLNGAKARMMDRALAQQAEEEAAEGKAPPKRGPETLEKILANTQAHLGLADKGLTRVAGQTERPLSPAAHQAVQAARQAVEAAQDQVNALIVLITQTQPPQASPEIGPTSPARACRTGPTHSPDFTVVKIAVGRLPSSEQQRLAMHLLFLMRGDPPEQEIGYLESLRAPFMQAGVPGPLFDEWLRRLCRRPWDERGRFALWFSVHARLPDLYHHVGLLLQKEAQLPAGLREMLHRLVPARDGAAAQA